MAATPALAQTTSPCSLEGGAPALAAIDKDGNGEITRDEYTACLDDNVADDQRQAALDAFDEMDDDDDDMIVIADLDASGGAQTTAAAGQEQPEVAVTQNAPKVNVEQAQPEVAVTQPAPEIEVQQPEAQVAIQQAEPRVVVDAPPPQVEVQQAKPKVTVKQNEPKVTVTQPEPKVTVETAKPNVEVKTAEPKVVVNQAKPEVVIEKVKSDDNVKVESASNDAADSDAADDADATAAMNTEAGKAGDEATAEVAQNDAMPRKTDATEPAAAPTGADVAAAKESAALDISAEEIEGVTATNNTGDDIGTIDELVIEKATGDRYVVVSVGGFLGIGDKDIAFPLSDVSMEGDRAVIDTDLSEDTLDDQAEYDESSFTEVKD
ncbi:PRC-barrel domain-containing protein [Acuticoccus sediminis]|uniref:PRC-barrel domain-containing protein n=1 Tax=Acuticoccus sediminis TaxID=2184697 RepID=UPI001CFDEB1C|nr:PRC-barrel domain-containing protein [Acuticoccus sediminis]